MFMKKKIRFGILGAAAIAIEHVIPAMQNANYTEVTAIASRDLKKAESAAKLLNIEKSYGSYEELLNDPDIDAIYNPLPNHLHVSWSIKALKAGKHVLCEKPIALNAKEAQKLVDAAKQFPNLKITEAFMYRFHPQWQKVRNMIEKGEIGRLTTIQTIFSYYDDNPKSIVNNKEYGGGGLPDIGCYPISLSRFLFKEEPKRIMGSIKRYPLMNIDILTSGILEFREGTSTFTASIRLYDRQRVNIFGTNGEIELEIPFNPFKDRPAVIYLKKDGKVIKMELDVCDQYGLQGDAFAKAILENKEVDYSLEDAVKQMKIIDAIYESTKKDQWITL